MPNQIFHTVFPSKVHLDRTIFEHLSLSLSPSLTLSSRKRSFGLFIFYSLEAKLILQLFVNFLIMQTVSKELAKILEAHRLIGIFSLRIGIVERAKVWVRIFVPVFTHTYNTFKSTQEPSLSSQHKLANNKRLST